MGRYLPAGMPGFHLDYPEGATVGDLLAGSARRFPDHVALRDGDLTLTYAELYAAARRVAGGLRGLGVGRGETVALHLPNSAWFTVGYYGILLAGAVVTPVNPALPAALLRDQLDEAGVVAVLSHPTTVARLAEAAAPGVRLVVLVPATHAAPGEVPDGLPATTYARFEDLLDAEPMHDREVGPDDVAQLSFTGGTTGRSKAVIALHRNVVANTIQTVCFRGGALPAVDEEGGIYVEPVPGAANPHISAPGAGTVVALAPLFHAMGLISQNTNVLGGAEVIMFGRFEPSRFVETIEQRGVTGLPGSPALFHALLAVPGIEDHDLSSVKVVNSGAAPIETATLERLSEVFPNALVVEGYGLTEATMCLTLHPLEPGVVPKGSVGAPVFDTELSIHELGGGPELPVGETGEVWARGPQITVGYRNHPELTAEQYVDGWLRTGDLGRLDEDGWLYLVGRAKDMLIYKGYNVYPSPLEELLVRHPAVAQASVIGAPQPDVGEIPVAFVVPAPSYAGRADSLAEELMAYVAERVAPYSRIREVVLVDALPTSAAGKVLKTELRASYQRVGVPG
ncbi:class I adenylate-forming enzyme family protein [Nocardioides sp. KR10-350]|uniref:class I adenylate-forming enzyme family protein n=1 Tax=Nocardioides cheoyonin TaxID=3156615 RepID=UPI0032B5C9DB